MTREEILNAALALIAGDRAEQYGDAEAGAKRIASRWQRHVGPLSPMGVMVMMAELKLARIEDHPGHADSWIDAIGYLALAAEMALSEPTDPQSEQR
jgi:Domain of unknown function (DUF6378)